MVASFCYFVDFVVVDGCVVSRVVFESVVFRGVCLFWVCGCRTCWVDRLVVVLRWVMLEKVDLRDCGGWVGCWGDHYVIHKIVIVWTVC